MRPFMKYLCLGLLLAIVVCAAVARAGSVETTVTYVSATGVYLDAGRAQGLAVGDTGEVRRGEERIARIAILFVADHSASARVIESSGEIRAGDKATVMAAAIAAAPDTAAQMPPVPPARETTTAPAKSKHAGTRLTGRIAVQFLAQDSRSTLDYNYTQPSLVLRLRAENLLSSSHTLNVRLRSRRTYQDRQFQSGRADDWYNRVYEVSLSYDEPAAKFAYAAGRLLSNRLSGIGYIDGARFDYRAYPRATLGTFAGTQPNLRTSAVAADVRKAGVYAVYERGDYNTQRLTATLAAAGEYHRADISREFLYVQLDWSQGSKLSLFQSAEIGVHRGWQQRVTGKSLALDNLLWNARYAPVRLFALSGGYDHRAPFRTWDTKTLADSLFDDAAQQGYRAGLDLRLPYALRADVRATLRSREHETLRARTLTLGIGTANLLNRHVALDGRVSSYRNRFTTGNQIMFSLSRYITTRWNAGAQIGRDSYDLRQLGRNYSNRWLRLTGDGTLTRHVYGSAYAEFYRGQPFAGTRGFMELGWRF